MVGLGIEPRHLSGRSFAFEAWSLIFGKGRRCSALWDCSLCGRWLSRRFEKVNVVWAPMRGRRKLPNGRLKLVWLMSRVHRDRHLLLFDGDCGICARLAEMASRMDRRGLFAIKPYQEVSERELARFGLSAQKCSKRVYVISRAGRAYGGAFGVNYFLLHHFPWSLFVALIYAVPILLLLEVICYEVVANNRHRISRWLGMKYCVSDRAARLGDPDAP